MGPEENSEVTEAVNEEFENGKGNDTPEEVDKEATK
jgi:hypothetical protein